MGCPKVWFVEITTRLLPGHGGDLMASVECGP